MKAITHLCAFTLGVALSAIIISATVVKAVDRRLDSIEYSVWQVERNSALFDMRTAQLAEAYLNVVYGMRELETNLHEWMKEEVEYFRFRNGRELVK